MNSGVIKLYNGRKREQIESRTWCDSYVNEKTSLQPY